MSNSDIVTDKNQGVTTLILNRPGVMNALSSRLIEEMADIFADLQSDPDTGVVILTGEGKAFSAGLDIMELSVEGLDSERMRRILEDLITTVRSFDRPIIGAVNGVAATGGLELALACDFLIASTRARFADTHARIGVMPGWGISQMLPRLIGINRAREISFTGNYISAQQALEWGLVNTGSPLRRN